MADNFSNKYFEKVNHWIETNSYSGTCSVFNTLIFLSQEDAQKALEILNENGYHEVNQLTLDKTDWSNYCFVIDVMKENIFLSAESIKNHILSTLILLKQFDFENNMFALIFQKSEIESDYFDPFK